MKREDMHKVLVSYQKLREGSYTSIVGSTFTLLFINDYYFRQNFNSICMAWAGRGAGTWYDSNHMNWVFIVLRIVFTQKVQQ